MGHVVVVAEVVDIHHLVVAALAHALRKTMLTTRMRLHLLLAPHPDLVNHGEEPRHRGRPAPQVPKVYIEANISEGICCG